ncbi:MAG: hypothetical protein JWM36_1531 [Hyphomicrobiales bacterium]|nr:hypothetical protein [Hyphomicrobiales bacterium]
MRFIEVADGLRFRFPGQSADFSAGVEIGALAVTMSFNLPEFHRAFGAANVEQARELAEALGYRVTAGPEIDGAVSLGFCRHHAKAMLRLVV